MRQRKYTDELIKSEIDKFVEECKMNNRIPKQAELLKRDSVLYYLIYRKYSSLKNFAEQNNLTHLYRNHYSGIQDYCKRVSQEKEQNILKKVVIINNKKFIAFKNKKELVKSSNFFNINDFLKKHNIIRLPKDVLKFLILLYNQELDEKDASKYIRNNTTLRSWLYKRYKNNVVEKFKQEFL